ncbi:hypothetical protein GH714_017505 [Hevea brasiliensis]|uniref:WEB family protein n=1 Tax=Hevea brasiliensis TaxID=3981 RepID=A0A6A6K910_HEVBR|nr:hypothetical protein GH714_017401 [Hevea brasiliensis]KAF2283947.1 hypothetical protein GH714_017505 [Hevea brasiliensis]
MQQDARQLEEELMNMKERLAAAERDRVRFRDELKEMKNAAYEANGKLTEAMSNRKVADVFSELNSAMESLSKSNEELKIKDKAIASLKAELDKAKELEAKMAEKDALLQKLKDEMDKVQSSEAHALDLLSKSKERIQELETELKKGRDSETKMLDSLAAQTKRFELTKMMLEESKLEVTSLHDEVEKMASPKNDNDKSSFQKELESLKSELGLAKENLARAQEGEKLSAAKAEGLLREMELLKNQLKQATEAEGNNKKAMDDLAIALKEVATEANQNKEKLIKTEDELESLKKESEELKQKFKSTEEKHKIVLDEARKEADLYRNTADRLRLEAEESLLAWNGKETGFVDCIKQAEDEKTLALEENSKLLEALTAAENLNKTAKEENQKLRDILKQALNEANVAKEAAGIAQSENSQLKDLLAEKDDALIFITRENENLRINEVSANENIKELKRLLAEASGKEFKPEDKEQEQKLKSQNSMEKEVPHKERKLSNAFSINLKDLIIHPKHKDIHEDQKISEKNNEHDEENEDSENADPLKGSIFDVDSPVATAAAANDKHHNHHHHHHHRRKSSTFTDEEAINPEDLEHLDGTHIDDVEIERNSRKKKALLRRFGDIITRRKGVHRRESSLGGESHKKEPSSAGGEAHKKDPTSSGSEGHKKEPSPLGVSSESLRREASLGE